MQYLASSCLANACLPTTGCLRAAMSPSQLGSDVFSHSFSMSIIQSMGSLWGPFMASRVPGVNSNASPILYQEAPTSRSSVSTSNRSLGPRTTGNEGFEHHYGACVITKSLGMRLGLLLEGYYSHETGIQSVGLRDMHPPLTRPWVWFNVS